MLGIRLLIAAAFFGHIVGILVMIVAHGFATLYVGALAIGLANGFAGAAVNPLVPTLYPGRKTERLNKLHVWLPGGIVIEGLRALGCTRLGLNWQVKMALLLPPVFLYGFSFAREKVPSTERVQYRVPAGMMFREALRPGFLVMLVCILLIADTELGPSQWIPSLLTRMAHFPWVVVLVWITGMEAIGHLFAGRLVAHISPIALLLGCTPLAAVGLFGLGTMATRRGIFLAATIFAVGVCFCWPTMYGITSGRFPAGGAFLLALVGGMGMLSDAFVVPLIGKMYDIWGPGPALRRVAIVPLRATIPLHILLPGDTQCQSRRRDFGPIKLKTSKPARLPQYSSTPNFLLVQPIK